MIAHPLSILSTDIRQFDGMYSLNDLHRASGREPKNRPGLFLQNSQTTDLVKEIETAGIPAVNTKEGRNGGTFGCKEIVVAYGAWISPRVHLAVIRAFLDQQADELKAQSINHEPARLTYATKEQREPLVNAVRRVVKIAESRGRALSYSDAHSIINLKMGVGDIEHLTVEQIPVALRMVGDLLQTIVLEGEYIPRGEVRSEPHSEQISVAQCAELAAAADQAVAGMGLGSGAELWAVNRLRVKFHVENIGDLPADQFEAAKRELECVHENLREYYKLRSELHRFVLAEVIGAGTPWTAAVARRWRKRYQEAVPTRPNWIAMRQQLAQ